MYGKRTMGAFNYITVEGVCPGCRRLVRLDAQTHIASEYGGFHAHSYHLGEPMMWYPKDSVHFMGWRDEDYPSGDPQGKTEEEACYAECPECKAELYVLIKFEGPCATAVEEIGLQDNWPAGYCR